MTYTARLNPEGTYTLMQDGSGIGLVKAENLSDYGLSATNLGSIPNIQTQNQAINAGSLAPQAPINLPQPPVSATDYNAMIASGQGSIGAFQAPQVPKVPEDALTTQMSKLLTSLDVAPPSQEEAYKTAYESSGIEAARQTALAQEQTVNIAQTKLAGIQAQIQAVVDKRNVQNLRLEKQASEGQVITTVLNRQQQEINRQSAIEALPLQALALAAQAEVASAQGQAQYAQSALKMAQDKLDNAFKLKSEDIKNAYEYKRDNLKAIYETLTTEQKRRADARLKQEERDYQIKKDQINNAQMLSKSAMDNGQADLAAKITQLDPNSSTYIEDLADLQAQITAKPATTTDITEYNLAKTQGYKGTFQEYQASQKAQAGESVVDIRQRKKSLADLLGQVPSYKTRDEAISELDKYRSSIVTKIGEDGYKQLETEVDRLFPPSKEEIPKEKGIGMFGAVKGFFSRLFGK